MSKPQHTEVLPPEDALAPAVQSSAMDIATTRQSAEIQSAMVIAKRFPRNVTDAYNRIMQACKRKSLAECACYAYPRGGTTVTGPSIRLAEALAQNWGNLESGIVELENRPGESVVMSFAYDLETNTRSTKIFTVKHERKSHGQIVKLDDPRDQYELIANQGARRLRSCILAIIPGDIIDSAIDECENTLKTGSKEPIGDRARKMVAAFTELGVNQKMIEARLGHKIDAIIEQELVNLRKIYTSIKDGAAKRDDFFDMSAVGSSEPSTPKHTLKSEGGEKKEAAATQPPAGGTGTATEPPKTDKPAEGTKAPTEADKLIADVTTRMTAAGVVEHQLVMFARKNKLCPSRATSLAEFTEANLKKIIQHWDSFVDNVKQYPVK